ncbi:MAG: hypothetical protein WCG25_03075 [bacterium]
MLFGISSKASRRSSRIEFHHGSDCLDHGFLSDLLFFFDLSDFDLINFFNSSKYLISFA